MTGIYKIENIINGKLYIGKAENIEKRWRQHLNDLRKNKHINHHLQKAFNKYGEPSFKFNVIIECDIEYLDYYEYEMIEEFNTTNDKFGYNLRKGGQGGKPNEEVNEQISKSISKLWENEEYKIHMSEVHKGHDYHGGGTKKGTHKGFESSNGQAVMIIETNEIFGSKSLCGEKIGCSMTAIYKAIKQNRKCKGYTIVLYNV